MRVGTSPFASLALLCHVEPWLQFAVVAHRLDTLVRKARSGDCWLAHSGSGEARCSPLCLLSIARSRAEGG